MESVERGIGRVWAARALILGIMYIQGMMLLSHHFGHKFSGSEGSRIAPFWLSELRIKAVSYSVSDFISIIKPSPAR